MSWFFSITGNLSEEDKKSISDLLPPFIYSEEYKNSIVYCGGIYDTCHKIKIKKNGQDEISIICGIGIVDTNDCYEIATYNNWEKILECNEDKVKELNGNFVIHKYFNNKIIIESDRLGTRSFYYARLNKKIIVTTRLDLIVRFCNYNTINFNTFSTLLYLQNQIGTDTIFKDINRCFSKIIINTQNLTITSIEQNWRPRILTNIQRKDVLHFLVKFIKIRIQDNKDLSISLSGGFDSRFLLSIALASGIKFDTHTFGNFNNQDIITASQITNKLRIEHRIYNEQFDNDINVILNDLKDLVRKTHLIMPISEYLHKRYYTMLQSNNKVIMDGGFGEILRNGMYYKLSNFGKQIVVNKNLLLMRKLLKSNKENIFKDIITQEFSNNTIEQLDNIHNFITTEFDSLFERKCINKEDYRLWLDIFSIYTKHLNYCAIEQTRTDCESINITPFLQPQFLDYIFSLDFKEKNNGKLMRDFIKQSNPILSKFHLVKNDTKYPYSIPFKMSKVYLKFVEKSNAINNNRDLIELIINLKEYIFDISRSISFRQFELYDLNKIDELISDFYKGKYELTNQMNWFITFELFRQEFLVKRKLN